MRTLEHVYHPSNLARAWQWVRSNPDAGYKNFFRSLYLNYSVADAAQLDDLRDRLQRGVYEPAEASKVFQPKPSGLLRPITLLTVEDQVVYQAMVNVAAERLHPKVKRIFDTWNSHLSCP
jgi:retron-type reverse transcriptase